jgi:hypothetical protein
MPTFTLLVKKVYNLCLSHCYIMFYTKNVIYTVDFYHPTHEDHTPSAQCLFHLGRTHYQSDGLPGFREFRRGPTMMRQPPITRNPYHFHKNSSTASKVCGTDEREHARSNAYIRVHTHGYTLPFLKKYKAKKWLIKRLNPKYVFILIRTHIPS